MKRVNFSAFIPAMVGFGASLGCSTVDSTDDTITSSEQELATSVCPEGVPAALTPAVDQTIKAKLNAVGVQVYMCTAAGGGYAWTFVAPQANLLNDDGKLVGTHFIGPTWQGNDASSVVGSRLAGATVDPAAIPWLLLKGTSTNEEGRFSDVTSIQRLSTVGGLAPVTGCDADHVGAISQSPYSAEYVFYRTKAQGRVNQCPGS
jgi:hypothetical protein